MIVSVAIQLLSFLASHGRMEATLEILQRNLEIGTLPLYAVLLLDPRLKPLRN